MERRLGRGLGSLIAQPAAAPKEGPTEIPLDQIQPNRYQPRVVFDEEGLEELQASIQNHGVLQPIVVRPLRTDDGTTRYELISGERRCRASRLAGKTSIPAVLRPDVRDEEMLELALVENVQRRDLDPIERAQGYRQMVDALQLTQDQVAERVGLRRSTVTNHLRLLELPQPVQEGIGKGLVSMGHARALLGLQGEPEILGMFQAAVREGLSVREVEKRVRATRDGASSDPKPKSTSSKEAPAWVGAQEERLRQSLGTKVRIQNGSDYRGQIVIEYFDQSGLEALLTQLAPKASL